MLPHGQRFMSETQRRSFAEGEAKGEARALLRVLERRGIAISTEQRERVLACSDLAVLEGWLDRAAAAASVQEVFAE